MDPPFARWVFVSLLAIPPQERELQADVELCFTIVEDAKAEAKIADAPAKLLQAVMTPPALPAGEKFELRVPFGGMPDAVTVVSPTPSPATSTSRHRRCAGSTSTRRRSSATRVATRGARTSGSCKTSAPRASSPVAAPTTTPSSSGTCIPVSPTLSRDEQRPTIRRIALTF